jgi:hypothetical protein
VKGGAQATPNARFGGLGLELTYSSSAVGHRASSTRPAVASAAPPSHAARRVAPPSLDQLLHLLLLHPPPLNVLRLLHRTSCYICCSSIPRRRTCCASAIPYYFFTSVSMACIRQRNKEIRRSVGGGSVHVLQSTRFRLTKSVGCWAGGEWVERALI